MKQILIPICALFTLFCSFTTETSETTEKAERQKFMLGFEIYRASDDSPLNHADIKIEIYDHTEERIIFTRDYKEMRTNKFSSTSYFENINYGHDLTMLIQAPNYFAKEINISYDPACTLRTKFCVNGLTNPPYEINGEYADRYMFPITLDSITIGEEMVIPNIYYKYNSAELQASSFWILDSLSRVIEHNPELSIELGGHADARGQDAYNMELSQRRVNSTKQYLIKKLGADVAARLTATGYGESQLINSCGNGIVCDEDLHQKNRRTTFKINKKLKEAVNLNLDERIRLRQQKQEVVAVR